MNFENHTAIVYGAGGGMGLNIANDLLAVGCNVSLVDLKPEPETIRTEPGKAAYFQGDATDETFVGEVTSSTVSAHGGLDHLVNATGVLWFDRDRSIVDIDMDLWDRVIDINLRSFALTARHAVPVMRDTGGGSMVHIASIDAMRGDDKPQDAYGVSKAAILRLSKSLAIQFASEGIRSNAILPGPVRSPMQVRWEASEEALVAIERYVPLGRAGETQDISNACLFLLSEQASFITGTELVVDGGCLAKP
jgi:NAD(P)-dependent dehydrogenase (short-subunit alcohol dehydrogenase family)|tara:strand:+ start:50 stop:799 length:750 start_codon:yes stop_codon:yes gene_type:complete